MPIKLPNLDDRTFADLVAEAHTMIPVHAPEWTNHNESDPGITLVELFAYLTEMQIYRLNRVTDANVCAFLKLIDGVERDPSPQNRGMITREGKDVALRDEVREVVLNLRQQDRAVTCEDFERLALAAHPRVSRAFCVARRDLTAISPYAVANAHVSVVIVPLDLFFDTVVWFDGKNFNDVTEASAGRNVAVPLKPPTAPANACLYLGLSTIFESLSFALTETGAGYSLAFEYFNGKDWAQLTKELHQLTDNTSNLSASGLVTFSAPSDWSPGQVNDVNAYWLRISSSTAPSKSVAVKKILRDPVDLGELIDKVSQYLEPRRLLTTRVHVVGPRFVTISVHVNLSLKVDAVADTVKHEVLKSLNQFLNQQTWPFGRNVYVSEIYRLLDRIPGVDHITRVKGKDPNVKKDEIIKLEDAGDGRRIVQESKLVAIRLNPDELVNFSVEKSEIVSEAPPPAKFET